MKYSQIYTQIPETVIKKATFSDKCVLSIAKELNTDLVKTGRSTYRTKDKKRGYVIPISKMYTQGAREKYWFVYQWNPLDKIADSEGQFVIYGCKNENIFSSTTHSSDRTKRGQINSV